MERVAGDVEGGHFGVADLDAFGVGVFVEFAANGETGFCRRRRDQFDDGGSAGQRTPAPVLRNVTEQAMLDLVPFRRAGRIVANADGQPDLVGELLQFDFPQAHARAVGAAAIRRYHEPIACWVSLASHRREPAPDGVDREFGGVVIDVDGDTAGVWAAGSVGGGIDHDTAEFAVNAIRRWLAAMGRERYPTCCLLYTSDAADEEDSVDLGGRRII